MGFQGSRRKPRDAWTDVTRVGRDGVLRVEAASKTSNGRVTRGASLFLVRSGATTGAERRLERSDDWSGATTGAERPKGGCVWATP